RREHRPVVVEEALECAHEDRPPVPEREIAQSRVAEPGLLSLRLRHGRVLGRSFVGQRPLFRLTLARAHVEETVLAAPEVRRSRDGRIRTFGLCLPKAAL